MPPAAGWNAELLLSSGSLRWGSNFDGIVTIIEAHGSCCVSCSDRKPCSQALTLDDLRQVTPLFRSDRIPGMPFTTGTGMHSITPMVYVVLISGAQCRKCRLQKIPSPKGRGFIIDGPHPTLGSGLSWCDSTRFDILIHAEQVFRIVLRFDRSEPRVIVTVCRLETPFSLIIHHEIHVSAAKVERMNGFPIRTSPRLQGIGPLRIGVDCGDHHRPIRVARIPRSGILCDAMDRPIDRIEMHQAECAGSICRLRDVRFDGLVRQRLHKVSFPIPLESFWEKRIEERIHRRKRKFAHPVEKR